MPSGKGFFLTFMVFLLIGAVLALNVVLRQSSVREEKSLIDESAFRQVNNAFNNIYSQIVTQKEGYAGRAQGRLMPVKDYEWQDNWVRVEQEIPVRDISVNDAYDAFNLFAIFVAGQQTSPDLEVEADAVANTAWGGSLFDFPKIGYLIKPQCLKYAIGDNGIFGVIFKNQMLFETGAETDECTFQVSEIERYDVEIEVTLGDCDIESTIKPIKCWRGLCIGNGCSSWFGDTCTNDDEDPENENPYASIHITITDCDAAHPNCLARVPGGEKTIGGHLEPVENPFQQQNKVKIDVSCTGHPDLFSDPYLEFIHKSSFENDEPVFKGYRGFWGLGDPDAEYPQLVISNKVTFENGIGSVELDALEELSVQKRNFDYCRGLKESDCSSS